MPFLHTVEHDIAEVTIAFPPVNALPVAAWFELAMMLGELGRRKDVRCIILAANGRGFCAGVDIKEIQQQTAHEKLIGANQGCAAAFTAVYECEVPVIAAVHGFCLGGGMGLVGNADIIVASHDASFGLPEVDRGALGAATHLSRMVPHHKMRAMVYTGERATAAELHEYGSVYRLAEVGEVHTAAREVASVIASKSAVVMRAAKQCLNAIDPVDVKRSYRFEQGFTFELNLGNAADEARAAFVEKRVEHNGRPE